MAAVSACADVRHGNTAASASIQDVIERIGATYAILA
jgi:hypothetical protein